MMTVCCPISLLAGCSKNSDPGLPRPASQVLISCGVLKRRTRAKTISDLDQVKGKAWMHERINRNTHCRAVYINKIDLKPKVYLSLYENWV